LCGKLEKREELCYGNSASVPKGGQRQTTTKGEGVQFALTPGRRTNSNSKLVSEKKKKKEKEKARGSKKPNSSHSEDWGGEKISELYLKKEKRNE